MMIEIQKVVQNSIYDKIMNTEMHIAGTTTKSTHNDTKYHAPEYKLT